MHDIPLGIWDVYCGQNGRIHPSVQNEGKFRMKVFSREMSFEVSHQVITRCSATHFLILLLGFAIIVKYFRKKLFLLNQALDVKKFFPSGFGRPRLDYALVTALA